MTNDFRVEYHGSIVLLAPVSEKAQAWCDEHMDKDALTFSDAYVVEPGYIGSILLGIENAGLTVSDTSKFSERQQVAERCIELLAGRALPDDMLWPLGRRGWPTASMAMSRRLRWTFPSLCSAQALAETPSARREKSLSYCKAR